MRDNKTQTIITMEIVFYGFSTMYSLHFSISANLFSEADSPSLNTTNCLLENGQRYQAIDIHYNGVGLIKRLPPEEFEKRFQNGKFKKPKLIVEEIEKKEKTA
jgi:hypothetical protein